MKPTKKTGKASQPKAAVVQEAQKPVLSRKQIDTYVGYNIKGRFKTTEYQNRVMRRITKTPDCTTHMHLVTYGPKGKLINAVLANNEGIYCREHDGNRIYGSVSDLCELEPEFRAELLTTKDLIETALKKAKVQKYACKKDNEEVEVVLFAPHANDSYFPGLTLDAKGNLRVINMEPPAKHNNKNKAVQWNLLKEVTDAKLVTRLTNYHAKPSKTVAAVTK